MPGSAFPQIVVRFLPFIIICVVRSCDVDVAVLCDTVLVLCNTVLVLSDALNVTLPFVTPSGMNTCTGSLYL